jgi:hypothetical protein
MDQLVALRHVMKDVFGRFLYHHMVIVNTQKARMDPTLLIVLVDIFYKDFGTAHGFHNIQLGNEHPQLIRIVTNQKWALTIFQLATIDTR